MLNSHVRLSPVLARAKTAFWYTFSVGALEGSRVIIARVSKLASGVVTAIVLPATGGGVVGGGGTRLAGNGFWWEEAEPLCPEILGIR